MLFAHMATLQSTQCMLVLFYDHINNDISNHWVRWPPRSSSVATFLDQPLTGERSKQQW